MSTSQLCHQEENNSKIEVEEVKLLDQEVISSQNTVVIMTAVVIMTVEVVTEEGSK